jgi:hypothetical protein
VKKASANAAVAECFGCGDLTCDRYRDLPLCIRCQQECTVLNQLFALPSEPPEQTVAREARKLHAFLRGREIGELARRWLPIAGLAVAACALVYIGWKLGDALIAWVQSSEVW